MTSRSNPITQRLDIVTSHWLEFAANPKARVCRWVAEPDEVDMLLAFVKVENANEAQTNDLFIRFRTPFGKAETYSRSLVAELGKEWEAHQNFLPKNGQPRPWSPSNHPSGTAAPQHFLNNFETFSRQFPNFEGLAVAVISPDENEAPDKLAAWLESALQKGIPQRLRLMLIDGSNSPAFEGIASAFPDEILSIRPNLDMPAAMRQIAATGDPKNPGVQFRKLFTELTQQAAKGNLEAMNRLGESAVSLAVREDWMYLQVATYIAMATGYIGKSQTNQALAVYDKAISAASAAWKTGDPLGAKLLAQALIGKGSILLGKKDYPAAAEIYKAAVAPASTPDDAMNLMEAWRMAGFCHLMNKELREAWDCNQHALEAGDLLDENLRPNSTLPYVGQALLRISEKLGLPEQEDEAIHRKMSASCGQDWLQKLSKKAEPS